MRCLPAILILALTGSVQAITRYAAPDGTGQPPYTTPETAASVLQDVADICEPGDEILAAPGIYTNGSKCVSGTLTNRVALPDGVTLRSINGPETTMIEGIRPASSNAVRCVYLGRKARLIGFTLRNGGTRGYLQDGYSGQSGGGAFCEEGAELENCILIDNDAHNYGGGLYGGIARNCIIANNDALRGGGAALVELHNCLIIGNRVSHLGAGAYRSKLFNCTVRLNTSNYSGGGVYETDATDSIVLENSVKWINTNHCWGVFTRTCTIPLPDRGENNLTDLTEATGLGVDLSLLPSIPDNVKTNSPAKSRNKMDRKKAALGLDDSKPTGKSKKTGHRQSPLSAE
ncbi:NosD domain-containing protein [Tichowtungia aerotolerans]|uniref:Periplasmic copper-binding protein NosD beta helix domain-containing protein n=1 Tax=Tichowtungia aerotolerans TaxID=2697043 RepID=A0A6P1M1Z7_9BACT|nr:right-handed parallel beta-helix repeat-containing protein [Tichowtungia aerotolerans]QHI68132.1 hypothetical protein GT409_01240 [Tichowtungia aerotolerans]